MKIHAPVLRTPRCVVRLATARDVAAVLRYWQRNGDRYVPPLPTTLLSNAIWRERAVAAQREFDEGASWKPYVFSPAETEVMGTIALSGMRVVTGGICCRLGYAVAAEHEGKGLMYESVASAVAHAFARLGVVRIEATCDAHNLRSLGLLERLLFTPATGSADDPHSRQLARER